MPSGKKKKGHKMATHKRKKRLRKNRHKDKQFIICLISLFGLRGVSKSFNTFDTPFYYQRNLKMYREKNDQRSNY